ncbi:hypothetical protein BIW11_12442 [Tropilaelaps mercedesae]|uniref:Uncharacterized protein n=1 Tax=Tropilaelaps mercedesae TaxID=418985 RepID=A0A1V9X6D0_9ACAR|nr:hypothetical protein BIW11_12442 [Tropilaelaps mercedesae]
MGILASHAQVLRRWLVKVEGVFRQVIRL